ncbi:MAG: hypothetical protein IH936_16525 [Acidobacteria bacterium]|nr:hypothetical protein [Acidobacteriota bacterium]
MLFFVAVELRLDRLLFARDRQTVDTEVDRYRIDAGPAPRPFQAGRRDTLGAMVHLADGNKGDKKDNGGKE